jgi:hypothetical protein
MNKLKEESWTKGSEKKCKKMTVTDHKVQAEYAI